MNNPNLSPRATKDDVKKPEGLPTRSLGPESPKTTSVFIESISLSISFYSQDHEFCAKQNCLTSWRTPWSAISVTRSSWTWEHVCTVMSCTTLPSHCLYISAISNKIAKIMVLIFRLWRRPIQALLSVQVGINTQSTEGRSQHEGFKTEAGIVFGVTRRSRSDVCYRLSEWMTES